MIDLSIGSAVALISPADGGRVAGLRIGGRPLLVEREMVATADEAVDPMVWGSYPMAPWCGRTRAGRFASAGTQYRLERNLGDHAIHGTVYTQPWTVTDASKTTIAMTCALGDVWPFGGVAEQTITLHPDRLECALSVTALGRAMPAQVGWHPWFVKPLRAELHFAEMYRRDATGITVAARVPPSLGPWDDCFVDPLGPLRLVHDDFVVTIASDCTHWVVYDMADHATCVEPQSGPPDGLNIAPHDLADGATLTRSMTIAWEQASPDARGATVINGRSTNRRSTTNAWAHGPTDRRHLREEPDSKLKGVRRPSL